MTINASNGRWVAQSREQLAFRSGGLSQPHIRLRLFCIPPASPVRQRHQSFSEGCPLMLWDGSPSLQVFSSMHRQEQELGFSRVGGRACQHLWKDLPYAVFGHSMGAWIAFEMAQEAKRLGLPEPALLIVSANRAPVLAASHHDVDPTIMHTLTYTDFWTAFERRYGTNPDLMDHRVRQMVWPLLQADFKLLETYQDTTSTILTCPLIAVGALQDNRYTADQVAAWGMHCRDFKENWVTGKHDYIIKSAVSSGLISIISNALAADAQFSTVEGHV